MRLVNSGFMGIGGIYKITNTVNGKCYIGRTKCFYRRSSQYRTGYRKQDFKYINEYMLNSMNKHGFDRFIFRIIEVCDEDELHEREIFWMNYFDSHNTSFGYNLRNDSLGGKMITHPETSKKISKRLEREWSEGLRSQHSEKLKISWEARDKSFQSAVMTKALTKYHYSIDGSDFILYKELCEQNLHGVVAKFAKHKADVVKFKGFTIERVLLNETR